MILVQRGKKGFYRLPGGRLGDTETLVECLKREMLEELNMHVNVGRLLYIVEAFYKARRGLTHEISFYFTCTSSSEPRPNEGHIEVEWVPVDEESLRPLRPRILSTVIPRDHREGWRSIPRYLVSFEDEDV